MTRSYCEFFDTEDQAIEHCREMNKGLDSKDPACVAVIDGPDNNWAVVDLETAREILDPEGSSLTCLVVTG